jgi:hypothetical protein
VLLKGYSTQEWIRERLICETIATDRQNVSFSHWMFFTSINNQAFNIRSENCVFTFWIRIYRMTFHYRSISKVWCVLSSNILSNHVIDTKEWNATKPTFFSARYYMGSTWYPTPNTFHDEYHIFKLINSTVLAFLGGDCKQSQWYRSAALYLVFHWILGGDCKQSQWYRSAALYLVLHWILMLAII